MQKKKEVESWWVPIQTKKERESGEHKTKMTRCLASPRLYALPLSVRKTREAGEVKTETKLQGGGMERAGRREKWGQSKETRWREREKEAWVWCLKMSSVPRWLAPALLRLYCQIKRGWNRAMGGKEQERRGKGKGGVVSRPGTLLWPHQSTHT